MGDPRPAPFSQAMDAVLGDPVPRRRKIAYGAGGFGEEMMMGIIIGYLLLYYNTVLGLEAVLVGWALSIPRLWDAITDPMMGQISDRFRSRLGRRRPFILLGGPATAICFFLLWLGRPEWSENLQFAYLLGICILFYTANTVLTVPMNALGMELSTDYNERTRVFAFRAFGQRIASLLVVPTWWLVFQLAPWWRNMNLPGADAMALFMGSPTRGFATLGFLVMLISTVAFLIVVVGTRENVQTASQKKIGILSAIRFTFTDTQFLILAVVMFLLATGIMMGFPLLNYLNIFYIYGGDKAAASGIMAASGYVTMLGTLACIPLLSGLAARVGKRNAFLLTLVCMVVGCLLSYWLLTPRNPWLQLTFTALFVPASAGLVILPAAMLADLIDWDELRNGSRREGFYAAAQSFLMKLSISGCTLANSYVLRWIGFDEDATTQASSTIATMRLAFMFFPSALGALGVLLLLFFRVNKQQVEEARTLLNRRQEGRNATST